MPNMLTLANLVAGAIAIVVALRTHNYELSLWLIVAAAVSQTFSRALSDAAPSSLK